MKKLISMVFLALFFFQAAVSLPAERPLRYAVPGPDVVFLPLWAAKETGLFDKHKVAVDLVYVGASPTALSAALAGEIDILTGVTGAISTYLQGYRDLAVFGGLSNALTFKIYAQPSIHDVSMLRGKRFGVTRFGGTIDFAVRYFLRSSGLNPSKDLTFIQVGKTADLVSALKAGSTDAAGVPVPLDTLLKKMGFREVADLAKSGARYATASFVARRQFLIDNRSRMEGFIKAVVESTSFIKKNRREALQILSKHTRIDDLETLGEGYDQFVKIWPRAPEIKPEDLMLPLEQVAEGNPKARDIDPSALIYGRLVEDVIKSGFVEQVYK